MTVFHGMIKIRYDSRLSGSKGPEEEADGNKNATLEVKVR